MQHRTPVGPPNAIHSMKEIDVVPLSLMYLIARMFCADAIVVNKPPALPLHARPKRSAFAYGSSGSRVLMIGSEKVKKIVVAAIFDKKPEIVKFSSMSVKRTMFGLFEMCPKANFETLSVIFNFANAAEIVRDPRKTKIIGSVNFAQTAVDSLFAGTLFPVVES